MTCLDLGAGVQSLWDIRSRPPGQGVQGQDGGGLPHVGGIPETWARSGRSRKGSSGSRAIGWSFSVF